MKVCHGLGYNEVSFERSGNDEKCLPLQLLE
jgi:hypothetical protein